jgi:hypothetical protein
MSQTVFRISFTRAIIPLFLSSSLWLISISLFFIFDLIEVIRRSPLLRRSLIAFALMKPLSAKASPLESFKKPAYGSAIVISDIPFCNKGAYQAVKVQVADKRYQYPGLQLYKPIIGWGGRKVAPQMS